MVTTKHIYFVLDGGKNLPAERETFAKTRCQTEIFGASNQRC